RWKTKSQPSIAFVKFFRSRLSPRFNSNRSLLSACRTKSSWPVEKSSQPTTAQRSSSNRSTTWLPMNPAAPVTKAFCIPDLAKVLDLKGSTSQIQSLKRNAFSIRQSDVRMDVYPAARLHRQHEIC